MASKIDDLANTETLREGRVLMSGFANAAGHNNMLQLIQLRWIAVIGQITTIAIVVLVLGIKLPVHHMLEVLVCLIAFNIASHLRWHERPTVRNSELFFALLIDAGILTAQLYLSGGTSNPFVFLYLLQIILSAVLLDARSTWIFVGITSLCLVGLSLLSSPLQLPQQDPLYLGMYVQGILICFILNAALLAFFITRISYNLRTGDAQLADLRKRALEEEHIVRMGLFASGAAHELGTPLATLSVILGDWRHMPEFNKNAELQQEIAEMQTQLDRCKSIVSSILLSAGEARGESSVKTTINVFLDDLAHEWRQSRAIRSFEYENHIQQDIPVVFDSVLKQTIWNVLDNAFEASPNWLRLDAFCQDDALILRVTDAGNGFPAEMLQQLGKAYQSSKGKLGSGLGLFLVVNVARKLGGTVTAHNREKNGDEGGAVVELTLPLAAISLEKDDKLSN